MQLNRLIVTFFFIGHSKFAPGSIASLITTLLFYLFEKHLTFYSFVIIIFITTILSFFAVHIYSVEFLKRDRSEIVIDEVIGQSIALLPLLILMENKNSEFYMYVVSLLLFRFFDIFKPYPIKKFDEMNNAFGILADDVIAGIFSAFLLTLILIF